MSLTLAGDTRKPNPERYLDPNNLTPGQIETIRGGGTIAGIRWKDIIEGIDPNSSQVESNLNIPTGEEIVENNRKEKYSTGSNSGGSSNGASGYQYTPFTYDDFTYQDYIESDAVKDYYAKMTDAEKAVAGYGDFNWSKQSKYDKLFSEYENRPDFSYDFNADALYQQYKDKYIQQGKMAMADTMGQAAALTGGYGNSYAATAGNQAYQASLQNLNDVIPELYQLALSQYNQKGQDMLNMLGMLGDERNFEYGVWGDKYNRLVGQRDYYGSQYNNERAFDYGKYSDDRAFEYGKYSDDRDLAFSDHTTQETMGYNNYRDAIEDEQWQKQYDEALRQFNEEMALEREKMDISKEQWQKEYDLALDKFNEEMALEREKFDASKITEDEGNADTTPTETKLTNSFIGNHQTKDEFMARGKSYKEYIAYVEAEINKIESSLSDGELLYLINYYGLGESSDTSGTGGRRGGR